jgi:predicted transport protein
MREKGHWGTGDLEVWVTDKTSLKKTQPLIERAYEEG